MCGAAQLRPCAPLVARQALSLLIEAVPGGHTIHDAAQLLQRAHVEAEARRAAEREQRAIQALPRGYFHAVASSSGAAGALGPGAASLGPVMTTVAYSQ